MDQRMTVFWDAYRGSNSAEYWPDRAGGSGFNRSAN
jgi:hypothetical protein